MSNHLAEHFFVGVGMGIDMQQSNEAVLALQRP